jgi:hypothetical protein
MTCIARRRQRRWWLVNVDPSQRLGIALFIGGEGLIANYFRDQADTGAGVEGGNLFPST